MVCIDMTGLTALCHYNCGAWQLVGLQTQEFYNILSLFVCGTPFLMAEYPLVTCLLILHLSHRIWKSDCSFGSLLGVAAAETDTKPQGGRNFAMLHFLPSYQIPVLAVVDIGKNPYTNACQRLLNGCHRMRMSLKISRYVIQKANSDKTYQFLCCRCTCQQWEHRLLPLPAGLEVQPKLSTLSFGRHFQFVCLRGTGSVEELVTGDCGFSVQCRECPYENICWSSFALKSQLSDVLWFKKY